MWFILTGAVYSWIICSHIKCKGTVTISDTKHYEPIIQKECVITCVRNTSNGNDSRVFHCVGACYYTLLHKLTHVLSGKYNVSRGA